jgi:two-component system, cell cycle sensor histidine kinase and response regulator CckA
MASPSQVSLEWKEGTDLSPVTCIGLEALPFAAAVVDANGWVEASNQQWAEARTEVHLSDAVKPGIRAIVGGESKRFSRQIQERGQRYLVTITPQELPSGRGALIVLQGREPQPERMPESEKMATVGRLLGGVVHDFANLLTLISGYSEIVLDRLDERSCLQKELEEIRKAANRGARLTGQLLGFTRGQTAQPVLLDLNEIVTGIVRMLSPIIGEHLRVDTELAPDLGKVIADPGQMEQVLMNLVLNARDAMPQGGRIVVETSNCDIGEQEAKANGIHPGCYALLSVTDTGHGIEPSLMGRLFEPLFTTKPKGKGTGLGLNTVKKIIEENRGAVWVRSVVGQGTTFSVSLPHAQAAFPVGPMRPDSLARAGALSAKTSDESVLVVEDEESVRRLLTYVLQSRGYQVQEASDGEEALRIYQESGRIHLVLTDMIMPRMGGRELAERLHRLDPDAKIVFMSGYTDDVLIRTGELGRDMPFLQKPLRPETVAAKVREALDSSSRPFNPR